MRLIFTLALACLVTSCAPQVATELTDAELQELTGKVATTTKPTTVGTTAPAPEMPRTFTRVNKGPGMTLPPSILNPALPDQKEFHSTTGTAGGPAPNLLVPAPKPVTE